MPFVSFVRASVAVLFAPTLAFTQPTAKVEDFVTVRKGSLPIVLSSPHGGRKSLPGISERVGAGVDKFVIARDENTAELTEAIASELEKAFGGKPWVVIARFERKQIDANRAADAAYESEAAKPHYEYYHASLVEACKMVKDRFGRGILLDIHGQAAFKDSICRGTQNGKTVKLLTDRFGKPAISGKDSLLGHLQAHGYVVRPSGDSDGPEEPKFNGGYIVGTYGSHTGSGIDAIQLEFGTDLRNKDVYRKTARDTAAAVKAFHAAYLK
ncbi:MAG: hypothetical protein U0746_00780 [Gemmataceae bacterium]